MSSSDDYYTLLLNSITVDLYRYVVPVFYIVGNLGNFFCFFIFWKKSWRKKVCVFYFNIHLLCSSCFINSYLLGSIFAFGYHDNTSNTSPILCKLFYYTGFLFSTLLSTILILASIDRLLISSQNVDTRLYSSRRLAYLLISVGTSVWIVFYVHVLIRYNVYEVYPSVFICFYGFSQSYWKFISYSSLVISALFSVLMIILVMVSFTNVRRIRAVPRQQRQNQIRVMTKKDFQLLRCLFVQDILYIICTIFLTICLTYTAAREDQVQSLMEQAINQLISNILACVNCIPSCADFFVFICVSKAFRNEAKGVFCRIIGTNAVVTHQEVDGPERENVDNIQLSVVNNAL